MTPEVKMRELLEEFGIAMLITRTQDGQLRGRPMAVAEVQPDGTLWFLTDRHSGKVYELEQDSHVAVTMQSRARFASLSGTISPVEDGDKVSQLWKLEWNVWFPGGKNDPSLLLLRFEGKEGEYWDNSGISGVRYLIEMGKGLLTRSRPDVDSDPKLHAKVKL